MRVLSWSSKSTRALRVAPALMSLVASLMLGCPSTVRGRDVQNAVVIIIEREGDRYTFTTNMGKRKALSSTQLLTAIDAFSRTEKGLNGRPLYVVVRDGRIPTSDFLRVVKALKKAGALRLQLVYEREGDPREEVLLLLHRTAERDGTDSSSGLTIE